MTPETQKIWRRRLLDLWTWVFCCLPHRAMSAVCYWLSHIETPAVKNLLIRGYLSVVPLAMTEAEIEDPQAYPSLNALFTRSLKPQVRPWPEDPGVLAAPCDSSISQFGRIEDGRIVQAKNQSFTAAELLGGSAGAFEQGSFATLYLSPQDCHRVYMPADGRLTEMRHIPGRQLSVAAHVAERVARLYARNERVVNLFEDAQGVPFAVVMVGAANVASIETRWAGMVAPRRRAVSRWQYEDSAGPVRLRRGEELGCFHLGSTVVVLRGADDSRWAEGLAIGQAIRYGQPLLLPAAAAE